MALSRNCEHLEKHIAIFHSVTHDDRKKKVIDDFVKDDGQIRILLCTSAFGMGVDIPNISTVIHYGPSRDVDDYFQESGRVGRSGEQSYAILINYKGRGKGTFDNDMKQYMTEHKCRRQMLLKPYGHEPSSSSSSSVKHDCCDVCSTICDCGQESCKESAGWAEKLFYEHKQDAEKKKTFKRNISPDDREIVKGLLIKYQQSLVNDEDESRLYTGTSIASGLPLQVLNDIVDDLHTIGDQNDLENRFCFFNSAHAFKIWNIIDEICPPYVIVSGSEDDSSSDSESNDSEASLRDFDSDCDEVCELIAEQYGRVTLPFSEESNSEESNADD